MDFELDSTLEEWAKDKPISILQLDPVDRAVLRIAGQNIFLYYFFYIISLYLANKESFFKLTKINTYKIIFF